MPKVIYTVLKSGLRQLEAVHKAYSCELRLQVLFYKLQRRRTVKSKHPSLRCFLACLEHVSVLA